MASRVRWLIVAGVVALAGLIYALQPILMPFLVGALFAYLGNPLVEGLMRFGWRRVTAVSMTFLALCLSGTLVMVFLLPKLWTQLVYLQSRIPHVLRWMNSEGIPWLEAKLHVDINRLDMDFISTWMAKLWQTSEGSASDVLSQIASSGLHVLVYLGLLALVPVVTFYLLLDWEEIVAKSRKLLPRRYEPMLINIVQECDTVLAAFVRGQLMVMVALGLIYGIGLQLIGIKLAMVIGLVAGLASIIPYVGFGVGIVTATIVALFQFGYALEPVLLVWLVFGLGQVIESWVLQPWLVGDKIGLPPVGVIFAIMAGGQLFGFVGMLLALPIAAIVVVVVRHAHAKYIESELYWQGTRELDEQSRD